MRICLVSFEYPPETGWGGIGTQTRHKARGLAARGHDVQVISATGRIKASVMCECVRCLSPFVVRLDIPVVTQFVPAQPLLAPGEYRMPPEEAENYYYQDDVVVLDDLVRQEVILAVPFSPQCRADCRGLCPQCGQDLNVGTCACAPPPDPRWAALREYLKGK